MKLVENPMINGDVVFKVANIGNIDVYQVVSVSNEEEILYFVQGVTVLKKLKVVADCSQNCGFISDCEFESVS